jgi:excisionase family DNA binding protein
MNQIYLTANEASELLRMSKSKLYKMTMCKSIPHYKCGGKVLFKTQELMDFVEKGIDATSVESIDRFDLVSPFSVAA